MSTTKQAPAPSGPATTGFGKHLGLHFVSAAADEVIVEMPVEDHHLQPMGIVHGGVYCALVETVCSVGAHLYAQQEGRLVVGVDNSTSFLRATREGRLRVRGVPLAQGRKTQLWEARVEDAEGRLVASGRVRLLCLDPGAPLGGAGAGMQRRD